MKIYHRNCTEIIPVITYPYSVLKSLRERTHGCWCSFWKMNEDGDMLIWRNGDWRQPKKGEIVQR